MNSSWVKILFIVALSLSALSCREPFVREEFIKSSKIGEDGMYHFDVEFMDSLAVYDISFYSPMDEVSKNISFPITVRWTSPSGWVFSERVFWDPSEEVILYRKDIVPPEYGVWGISVRDGAYPQLCGLGIIMEKKDGTR